MPAHRCAAAAAWCFSAGWPPSGRSRATSSGRASTGRSLALEFGPLGLRCNVIAPSLVDTPLLDALHADDKDERCRALAARLPVGRIGTAGEAAMAAVFLMANGYIDGQVLGLDGGHLSIP
jgi:NAD(P)-dependent dehydrogenase (short-subunit alcohol dehydrogenase family)